MERKLMIPKTERMDVKVLIYIFIVIVFALFAIGVYSNSDQISKFHLYVVQSGSMRPKLREGDLIFTYKSNDYEKDDIITFKSLNSQVITHRIVENLEGGNFRTKGDYNSVVDIDPVTPESIIGEFLFKIPLIGYVLNFVKSDIGLIVLIVIPCTLLIYEEIKKIKTEVITIKNKE